MAGLIILHPINTHQKGKDILEGRAAFGARPLFLKLFPTKSNCGWLAGPGKSCPKVLMRGLLKSKPPFVSLAQVAEAKKELVSELMKDG